jgi:probable F420-dependent oxidoreductase
MTAYTDTLAAHGIDGGHLCLAAFRPKMLEPARDRTSGAHPYLVTPAQPTAARALLGSGGLLAPRQAVAFELDPAKARAIARGALSVYLNFTNYIGSWKEQGFADADIANGGSDPLYGAFVGWGDINMIAARVKSILTRAPIISATRSCAAHPGAKRPTCSIIRKASRGRFFEMRIF